jgi:HTH-type transcriptional regulator / antitoxin HigA
MITKYKPFLNIPPSEFIKEEMEERGWTQEDLAHVLGVSPKTVSKLINNKQGISIDIARLLSKVFGQSPNYWLNLYNNYVLRQLDDSAEEHGIEMRSLIYNYMPITEMKSKGWILSISPVNMLRDEVLALLGKDTLDRSIFERLEQPALTRKSEAYEHYNPHYAFIWFQMARSCAAHYNVSRYDKAGLKQLADELHKYTITSQGVEAFLERVNNVGVKFFVLSHLSKTYIDGASFFDEGNPVIVYSQRLNRIDNFWFVVAHEIAHILFHFQESKDFFVDIDLHTDSQKEKREQEADEFALKIIREKDIIRSCRPYKYKSNSLILECSRKLQISSGIIVGVLQHRGMLSRKNLNKYKYRVSELIPDKYLVEREVT